MKKIFIGVVFLSKICFAQQKQTEVAIIPQPVSIEYKKGVFFFDNKIDIVFNDTGSMDVADMVSEKIKRFYGFNLQICEYHRYKYQKAIWINEEKYSPEDGYELEVTPKGISI